MTISGPPSAYFFEDRTGVLTGSDFDEVYDRAFLRISSTPQRTRNAGLMVYDMGQRSTSLGDRDRRHFYREPVIVLDFGPRGALGTIRFTKGSVSVPMHQYLRKVSLFSGCVVFASERAPRLMTFSHLTWLCRSLFRKFTASDGNEYKWGHHMVAENEWTVR
jgi:hypothetical protein